jgi:hypothetical protein
VGAGRYRACLHPVADGTRRRARVDLIGWAPPLERIVNNRQPSETKPHDLIQSRLVDQATKV